MQMAPQQSCRLPWALIAPLVCLALFPSWAAAQDTPAKPTVHSIREIGKVLAACMQPLTLREHYLECVSPCGLDLTAEDSPWGHHDLPILRRMRLTAPKPNIKPPFRMRSSDARRFRFLPNSEQR